MFNDHKHTHTHTHTHIHTHKILPSVTVKYQQRLKENFTGFTKNSLFYYKYQKFYCAGEVIGN